MVTDRMTERRMALATNRKRAKDMRHLATEAEQRFWNRVRAHRLNGHKFKRQYTIGNYIVDFVCLEHLLIVELDGGQHDQQQDYDRERDKFLDAQGYRVMRFWNSDVFENIDGVMDVVLLALE